MYMRVLVRYTSISLLLLAQHSGVVLASTLYLSPAVEPGPTTAKNITAKGLHLVLCSQSMGALCYPHADVPEIH